MDAYQISCESTELSLEAKRKLLQKASVGDGVLSGLAKLALPMMKTFFRAMQDRD